MKPSGKLRRPAKISPVLIVSIVANTLLLAAVAYYFFAPKPGTSGGGYGTGGGTTSTAAPAAGTVESLGRIQPSGGLIAVYGPPGEKIAKFNVKVGDLVEGGKELAQLSGDTERQLNLTTLDAQIKEAETLTASINASKKAKLEDLDVETVNTMEGLKQDMAILDVKISVLTAQLTRATKEKNRLVLAKDEGVGISEQELEQIDLTVEQAKGELEGAKAQKRKLEGQKEQSGKLIEAKKASIEAETNRALAQVPMQSLLTSKALAVQKVGSGKLNATKAGRVIRILLNEGDTITNQPVVQLANVNRMSVLAEVYETDVGRIREWLKKGPVAVEIDGRALGDSTAAKLHGSVAGAAKISTVISRNALTPLGPREDADRRVVEVEVDLDAASSKAAETFIGLQVRVRFEPPK